MELEAVPKEGQLPFLELSLLEWPEGPERGGPRLLGRISDPDLVDEVRRRIAADRRRELSHLEPPVRLVTGDDREPDPGAAVEDEDAW